jgi:riboflavin-specific deaminase-like protein
MLIPSAYWQQLLALKIMCDTAQGSIGFIGFSADCCQAIPDLKTENVLKFELIVTKTSQNIDNFEEHTLITNKLYLHFAHTVSVETKMLLKLYVPLASSHFHHFDSSFVIVHMAQSLDGKVCTKVGNSKWIGNQENLEHAHRIRALVDGVVVGGNTARSEHPSLNVRHVEGPNPTRVLLCNSSDGLLNLPPLENVQTILLCQEAHAHKIDVDAFINVKVDLLTYDCGACKTSVKNALAQLKRNDINSILVEGGPYTIKSFVESQLVNWLQIHTAPLVFGSGHAFINLDEITNVDEALALEHNFYTQMGDAIMVTGCLKQ